MGCAVSAAGAAGLPGEGGPPPSTARSPCVAVGPALGAAPDPDGCCRRAGGGGGSPRLKPGPTDASAATEEGAEADGGPPESRVDEREISVTLDKGEGVLLGFCVRSVGSGCGMVVESLQDEGAVREWNELHPLEDVRPGDMVVEVNGRRGGYGAMLAELQKVGEIGMCVLRREPEAAQEAPALPEPAAPAAAPAEIAATCDRLPWPAGRDLGPAARHQVPPSLLRLQFRSLGPEDFEQLLMLDECLPKCNTAPQGLVDRLERVSSEDLGVAQCRICFEDVEPHEHLMRLPCRHAFHQACAERWLTQHRRHCPLCSAAVEGDPADAAEGAAAAAAPGAVSEVVPLAYFASSGGRRPGRWNPMGWCSQEAWVC